MTFPGEIRTLTPATHLSPGDVFIHDGERYAAECVSAGGGKPVVVIAADGRRVEIEGDVERVTLGVLRGMGR